MLTVSTLRLRLCCTSMISSPTVFEGPGLLDVPPQLPGGILDIATPLSDLLTNLSVILRGPSPSLLSYTGSFPGVKFRLWTPPNFPSLDFAFFRSSLTPPAPSDPSRSIVFCHFGGRPYIPRPRPPSDKTPSPQARPPPRVDGCLPSFLKIAKS